MSAVQEAEAARVVAEKKEVESKAADTPLDTLRRTIEAALAAGATVLCPKCGTTTEKNDACMHMTCHCGAFFMSRSAYAVHQAKKHGIFPAFGTVSGERVEHCCEAVPHIG